MKGRVGVVWGSVVSVAAVAAGALLGGVVVYRATQRRRDRYWPDDGASAVEYGLLVAAVAATILTATFLLGHVVSAAFANVSSTIQSCDPSGCPPDRPSPP